MMNYKKVLTLASVVALTLQGTYLPVNAATASMEEQQQNETLSSSTETKINQVEGTTQNTEASEEPVKESQELVSSMNEEVQNESSSLNEEVENSTASSDSVESTITPFEATDIVDIPDPVLFDELKHITGKIFADNLTKADLESITGADISYYKGVAGATITQQIYDLTGLEYATNLIQLSINNLKNLQNINPLRSLPSLTTLYAESTSITDISAIEDMPVLTFLSLSGSPIADFSPILHATKLEEFKYDSYIYFDPNNHQMTVEEFNQLIALNNLEVLTVPNNKITDISALRENTALTHLDLTNNSVGSLEPLTEMRNLESVYLDSNNLSSLDELSGFTTNNVSILYADNNHITDLHNLKGLFEGMQKVGDHKGLQINNQTITLPKVTAKVGEDVISNNPTIDINGKKMLISGISDNGVASSDNQTVEFNDLSEGNHIATYKATYSTTSSSGVALNYSIIITQPIVITPADVEDKSSVTVHDSTIYAGDEWKAEDNFDTATAMDGSTLNYTEFIAQGGQVDDSRLDVSQPGTYSVDYTINGVTSSANVTVKAIQTAVNVHDSTIYAGSEWSTEDNFDSAMDKDGNAIDFSKVTASGTVDVTTPGQYEVTYSYDGVTTTATITVKAIQTAVNVHDSTIHVGSEWSAEDNFDSAMDKDGNPMDFADMQVEGTVDVTTPGQYEVAYSYDGITTTAMITVKAIQTAVNVHDSTIYVGSEWSAEDNFDSAMDKDGNPMDFADMQVEGTVDVTTPGQYEVAYSYDGITTTAMITVKAIQTAVNVHDSTIYVGSEWSAEDNFDSAMDKDGNPMDFADMQVEGTVDVTTPGQYEVAYSYDGITTTAMITVKAIQTAVNVHDSTIYVGSEWSAEDNFDSAMDKDGNPMDFADMQVEGTVDVTTPGQYEVAYSYDGITTTAMITVKAIQTAVNVHDSTIYVGSEWSAEDNFDSAMDKDGNPMDFADMQVEGTVDVTTPGQYEVAYSYDGITTIAMITVKAIQTAVNVHDSTIYVGSEWSAEDNFDSAMDKDGNPMDFTDMQVEGTVDVTAPGQYGVTYNYDGVTTTATITVKVKQRQETTTDNPENNSQESKNDNQKKITSSCNKPESLPKTGETKSLVEVVVGSIILCLTGLFLFWKKRKTNE
jgi:LPXTG-motif cell wall-anchored protein